MSSIFNIRRFSATLSADIASHRRRIVLAILSIFSILIIFNFSIALSSRGSGILGIKELLGEFNMFVLMICVGLAPSYAFHELADKSEASGLLMLPASSFEKWASRWLLTVPLFALALFAVACVADLLTSVIWCVVADSPEITAVGFIPYIRTGKVSNLIFTVLSLQSVFFLGSLLWPKFSWAKTAFALTVLLMLYLGLLVYFNPLKLPLDENLLPAGPILAIILYVISYFRFKEAEIVNHW